MGQVEIPYRWLRYTEVTTTVMPMIPNYDTKYEGKQATQYNTCLGGKLPLYVLTGSLYGA